MKSVAAVLTVLALAGCAQRGPAPRPLRTSGFLDDYTVLRESAPGDVRHVYRNPDAHWASYSKVLLEPVTIWRSGRKSLEPVPKEDLLRLVEDFQSAVRARLGRDFRFVDKPGPGALRIRLAITDADAADPVLDVLAAPRGTGRPHPAGGGTLDPETRRFLESAVIEGDIRDAKTNVLLAAGVESRRPGAQPFRTWDEVDQAFAVWADRLTTRFEGAGAR
jgi:hypothetical protein